MSSIFDNMTDEQIARTVRMLTRADLEHESVVCAARDRILKLSRELADLKTIVEKLPKLADGITAIPGADVFCPLGHAIKLDAMQKRATCHGLSCYVDTTGDRHQARYELGQCYSSREALDATRRGVHVTPFASRLGGCE